MGIRTSIGLRQQRVIREVAKGVVSLVTLKYIDESLNKNFKKVINTLEANNLITLAGEKITLTEKGLKTLNDLEADDFKINQAESWDGVWRLIVYDIPNEFNSERRYFRKKLKEQGFLMIQKSVWAYPYDCKEEIAVFAHKLRISPFVIYLVTDHLPGQNKVREFFNI